VRGATRIRVRGLSAWTFPVTPTPAPTSWLPWGNPAPAATPTAKPTPWIPTPAPAPTPLPTDPPPPIFFEPPEPSPEPDPEPKEPGIAASYYEEATEEIAKLYADMAACSVDTDHPLPAELVLYEGDEADVKLAYERYLNKRGEYQGQSDAAAINCASPAPTPSSTGGTSATTTVNTGGDPYQYDGDPQEDGMTIEPGPLFTTPMKVGMSIGGLLVVGGIALLLARRKKYR